MKRQLNESLDFWNQECFGAMNWFLKSATNFQFNLSASFKRNPANQTSNFRINSSLNVLINAGIMQIVVESMNLMQPASIKLICCSWIAEFNQIKFNEGCIDSTNYCYYIKLHSAFINLNFHFRNWRLIEFSRIEVHLFLVFY